MWEFEHSVETTARRDFAWSFWTDVANWAFDTSIEWVRLEGPFASGTKGATKSPGLDPMHWVLRDVQAEKQATVEMDLAEATLRFHWRFQDIEQGGTRIIQRVTLTGPNAEALAQQGAQELERGIPLGMQRLATEITLAEERQRQNAG
jgi:Polyketide cyclase / dehydrase and lipid transport